MLISPDFSPIVSQIEDQHSRGLALRNFKKRVENQIDIHYLCLRLLKTLIENCLEPFASCQGHVDLEKLSPQERYNTMRSLVYNPDTGKSSCKFVLHRKIVKTTENGEKLSNAYLGIKMNNPLAKKLYSEIKASGSELNLTVSILINKKLNLPIMYIYSHDSDWLAMEQTINQLLEKIKLEEDLVENRAQMATAA